MARVLMIVQHPVKDFDAWRIEYDKAQPIRDRHGVTDAAVFRNADDPTRLRGSTGSLRSMKLTPSPTIPI